MAVSRSQYISVLKEARKILKDSFDYYIKLFSREDDKDSHGYYKECVDAIYLKNSYKYKTKSLFARVLYHELAHWAMCRGKYRSGSVDRKYRKVEYDVEEVIAERVSKKMCQLLGHRVNKKIYKNYTNSYLGKIKRKLNKKQYVKCLRYINYKVDKTVVYLCRHK